MLFQRGHEALAMVVKSTAGDSGKNPTDIGVTTLNLGKPDIGITAHVQFKAGLGFDSGPVTLESVIAVPTGLAPARMDDPFTRRFIASITLMDDAPVFPDLFCQTLVQCPTTDPKHGIGQGIAPHQLATVEPGALPVDNCIGKAGFKPEGPDGFRVETGHEFPADPVPGIMADLMHLDGDARQP